MRAFHWYLVGAFALLASAADAGAQWPGEVRGDVVDALSGRPLPSVDVRLEPASVFGDTDARGAFRLRGIEAGAYTLHARAVGYRPAAIEVVVENAAVVELEVRLTPEAIQLEGVVARVDGTAPGTLRLDGEDVRGLSVATAGDVAATLPGVRIEERGRGAAQVPSIRGSGGDAVLVLVDGVPINDPVTGEADLSTVAASSISSMRVLPGGRSARYGARAEGGVILVETSGRDEGQRLAVGFGSLGERTLDAGLDHGLPVGMLRLGLAVRRLDGGFDFEVPESAGGGHARRDNAHVASGSARGEWVRETDRSRLRVGASGERLKRGLPGRSFAPSRTGEQELERVRVFGRFEASGPTGSGLAMNGYWVGQGVDHVDPDPPFGDPFDDRTTLRSAGGEVTATISVGSAAAVTTGLTATRLRVRSTQLAADHDAMERTDVGAWASVSAEGPAGTDLTASARLDRSSLPSRWYASHDLGLAWRRGEFAARLGHRSSFSPPTLGDQFFREGVGVEPNPDLEAERVPSEWIGGLTFETTMMGAVVALDGEVYIGDVRGMIVWLPDFRFVWSPRNQDVRRRGVDLSARSRWTAAGIDVRVHGSWNRTTYERASSSDVQVVYRPELSGGVVWSWSSEAWSVTAASRYTGARYPVPNRVNELPGFWTTDLGLARRWRTGIGTAEVRLEIDRAFDHDDSLIFAFPDPGRTARLAVRISR